MTHSFWDIIYNPALLPALTTWITAQFIKTLIVLFQTKKWQWGWFLTAGGMPSSHSAMIMAVTITAGLTMGFDSMLFGVSLALASIVMYDAAGVRRESGNQARAINMLVEQLFSGEEVDFDRLKELIGHKPIEVLAGAALGILVALVYHFIR
ncbi:MAG: divergent PAP2 family protein [Christensenellales bacterium]|jgi:acid phosphatase family membrane protein YuiD